MIEYIKLLFAMIFPMFVGYVFISAIAPKSGTLSLLEKMALSFLVGSGILTLCIMILGACQVKLVLANILIAALLVTIIPLYLMFRNRSVGFVLKDLRISPFKWFELPFLLLIFFRIYYVLYETAIKPVIGCDAFTNWSLRAKVFFFDGGLSVGASSRYFGGGGAAFYPLNIPLLETWILNVLGYWNDELIKVIFAMFFISLLIIFYCSVRRSSSRFGALFFTYLLSTLPFLVYHATIEYADLPLAIYFTASILMLLAYFESNESPHLYLSALLAGIGTWTKSEGMPYLFIGITLLLVYYLKTKKKTDVMFLDCVKYFMVAMIFKVPWSIFTIFYHIPKNEWQKFEFDKIFANAYRIPVIIGQFSQKMFLYGNWNIAWFVFFAVLVLSLRRLASVKYLYSLLAVALCLAALVLIYYITPNYAWLLDGTSLNRNMLLVMPMVVFFVAVGAADILGWRKEKN